MAGGAIISAETLGYARRLRARSYLYAVPCCALLAVALPLATGTRLPALTPDQWWYLLLLATLIPLARRFPVRLGSHFVVVLQTPPLLLLALLLPVPYAALGGFAGCLSTEVLMRRRNGLIMRDWRRGMDLRDLANTAAAGFLSTLAAGLVVAGIRAQTLPGPIASALGVICGGAIFLACDLLCASLHATRREGGNPLQLFATFASQSIRHEAAQVMLAGFGLALVALHPVALVLLPLLAVPAYLYLLRDLQLRASTRAMLIATADAVDRRDPTTCEHSRRVAAHVSAMARRMHIGPAEADLIVTSALVHDIGKMSIPDTVLFKPGALDAEERRIMQSHATLSADLLAGYRNFGRGVGIVRHHHEAWNGAGYPDGLAGSRIPQGARMIAVADSYDAMVSDRPYRSGMAPEVAIAELRRGRDVQWEGYLVDIFLETLQAAPSAEIIAAMALPALPASLVARPG